MGLHTKRLLIIAAILLLPFRSILHAEETAAQAAAAKETEPVAVDMLFNPLCGPSLQSIQLLFGPLKPELDEDPRVQFTVIPVMLGDSARERRTLAALLCQIRRIGTYRGVALVAAEVKQSLASANPGQFRFSWERSRPGAECTELSDFEREIDEIARRVKVNDWPGTPTLYVNGVEVVIDPALVREAIRLVLYKG